MKRIVMFLISMSAVVAMAQTQERRAVGEAVPYPLPPQCSRTTTDVDGVMDNFGGGLDTTTVSPALAAFLATIPPISQYDDPSCDKHFGESFQLCGCETCGAKLEIQVRRCGPGAGKNDGYTVGIAPFGAGKRVTDGLVWAATDPLTKLLTIQLTAADLNKVLCGNLGANPQTFLDVYIQDDTIVDWIRLTVMQP